MLALLILAVLGADLYFAMDALKALGAGLIIFHLAIYKFAPLANNTIFMWLALISLGLCYIYSIEHVKISFGLVVLHILMNRRDL